METFDTIDESVEVETSLPPLKIILIEDDEDDFVLIRDFLSEIRGCDFTLDWIQEYKKALETFEDESHDVCLLDYRLGYHDGFEILEKAKMKGWKTPIIFLTGHGEYDLDVRAMQAGVADYLVKDQINAQLLERSIRYAIDRSKSMRALEAAYEKMEQKVIERTANLAEANAQLKESSEKIKRFAYSIFHDLKSPVIGIYGLTRRLFDGYADRLDEKGKRHCEQILRASEQIAALVENINIFIASKEIPILFENVKLKELCGIIRDEFSAQLDLREIHLSEPYENPEVRADRLSLLRALRNMVDNALKYGGDELSRIEINYLNGKENHVIAVKDNGSGLTCEDPQKIFGLFFRENDIKNKTVNGTGLGLAIVKEIANRHRGEVWAESHTPRGTTIFMSISKEL
ncbi:MAG: response regulator [Deltaproteobacteria bacterium]|nr:response regulator [Deltaproteobacteria bacterium]